jgi:hypothetical protein
MATTTLGYTEVLAGNATANSYYFYVGTAPFDGVVNDINFHATNYQNVGMAVYTGTSSAPSTLIANSDTGVVTTTPGSGWLSSSYSTKPAITSGQHIWVMCYRNTLITVTKGDDELGEQYKTGGAQTSAPETASFSSTLSNRALSAYITVQSGTGGTSNGGGMILSVGLRRV